jgi:hypothetical protein
LSASSSDASSRRSEWTTKSQPPRRPSRGEGAITAASGLSAGTSSRTERVVVCPRVWAITLAVVTPGATSMDMEVRPLAPARFGPKVSFPTSTRTSASASVSTSSSVWP